ncbi:MAG TPA: DUF1731 domain-containing protein [Nannocystis exedens]|nr:DUF1731 domain-containing protein [Nannocystis exedens]
MKIVMPGGSGQVGKILLRAFADHEVVVLSRRGQGTHYWDGETLGDWAQELECADVVINLAGRSVNCRYTDANLKQMMSSRVLSTEIVGRAIAQCSVPPKLWLQMSTATIYAHRFDAPNDEDSGIIGGWEPDAPVYWKHSIDIGQAWEAALWRAEVPGVRRVALRTAMVMSRDPGGVFSVLLRMVKLGLGGPIAGGRQYVSWIHEADFVGAIRYLIDHSELDGAVNLAAPGPLPQGDFMAALRLAAGRSLGLPATAWMAEIGAWVLRTDTELLLKSRYVVPGRLLAAGYQFQQPEWAAAARALLA